MAQKWDFLTILKHFVINFCLKHTWTERDIDFYHSVQIPYLGKFFFSGYSWESSQPIILQDYLVRYIPEWNQLIPLIVCVFTDNQKRKTSYLIFLIRWLGMPSYAHGSTWAQRLSESSSFTENSIEWKLKIKKNCHAFLVHRLSQKILLPSQTARFIYQPDI